MLRMMRHMDAQLSETSLEGWQELKADVSTGAKLATSINPKWAEVLVLTQDMIDFFSRTYFNADGTKKRATWVRIIKTAFKAIMAMSRIYFIFKKQ